MSVPMFYPLDTMTVPQWFSMLSNENIDLDEEEQKNNVPDSNTRVYQVEAFDDFIFNKTDYPAGTYFLRAKPDEAEDLEIEHPSLVIVDKLSFSYIVYLSDIFSTVVNTLIPEPSEFDRLIEAGEASRYFEKELKPVSCKGLETMRERVWTKYFDQNQGLMGIVRRFFSALANFFRKYVNLTVETNISWPGNSCHYADQVVYQLNKIKCIFICQAYEASKEVLSERLELSVEELEKLKISDLKKFYTKKALALHPDKNPGNPHKAAEFEKVNSVWGDFIALGKLKEEFQSHIDQIDDEFSDSEEDFQTYSKKKLAANPLAAHKFKTLLSLPAPIAVT